MITNNRVWIAIDRVVFIKLHTHLLARHVIRAQKARTPLDGLAIDRSSSADNAVRYMTDMNIEPIDSHCTRYRASKTLSTGRQKGPNLELLLEQSVNIRNHLLVGSSAWRRLPSR